MFRAATSNEDWEIKFSVRQRLFPHWDRVIFYYLGKRSRNNFRQSTDYNNYIFSDVGKRKPNQPTNQPHKQKKVL